MPAHKKSLADLVRHESFLRRRHAQLLVSDPLVADAGLRRLQQRYRDEQSQLERQQLALDFEKAVRDPVQRALLDVDVEDDDELDDQERPQTLEEELEGIINAPPAPWNPEKNRAASKRFARAVRARDLRLDGLPLTAIAERLGVARSTVKRYLEELERR